ncbi:MAG: S9 family peptidase, partial [Betaproteobacteria bacterium]|nr:S9 family peptidase [Betaproteobacteria bacterium]
AEWGRWPEAQFFASRGYVVLEPEPRGSLGFGRKHYTSSFKQWGLTMQDDITDGALHLVNEGIVDKKRMCLHGGSYGGYATLQGLVKNPDLWRCGSPFVAVTDMFLLFNDGSDVIRFSDAMETDGKRLFGDPKADVAQFELTSPARNAGKIQAPVLLAMGVDDERVPLVHGKVMRDALEKAGKKFEYVQYEQEGHGFVRQKNIVDFYTRLEKFFAENLK